MVHALEEAHRVLCDGGILADLRPDRWQGRGSAEAGLPLIYCTTDREAGVIGYVGKTEARLRSYVAADEAVNSVRRRGLFASTAVETFPFADFFVSLEVLEAHAAAHWRTSFIDDATRARIQVSVDEDPSREIVVVEPVRLNVMRKR